MRKEIIVYVNTNERGEEISVSSLRNDRSYVIMNVAGVKVAVSVQELETALQVLKDFNAENSGNEAAPLPTYNEITYGD